MQNKKVNSLLLQVNLIFLYFQRHFQFDFNLSYQLFQINYTTDKNQQIDRQKD
ncbi:hypothetical protein TTHERM_00106990 (macronuclear) [Tetrahymena thermophila SB210]|uniref:Uncharacterized protein n=1 Tax=Tetrahymena thermophila (strain SB210) TaxID=312017 RepID=Q234A5_TETTS|nr:hypothetical protein TTHERM_00106990 [Tetrahymena thermophila SB210]EAR92097.1 hypothetical protein TTHERM_00106990 [Tetrahymena thermophila SB210]|eukprot:XP_001012343.1 hypothetical protein TTHERM_00106990 [Tetrahymena thermophila SB210]